MTERRNRAKEKADAYLNQLCKITQLIDERVPREENEPSMLTLEEAIALLRQVRFESYT